MITAYEIILALLAAAFIAYPFLKVRRAKSKSSRAGIAGLAGHSADELDEEIEKEILKRRRLKDGVCPQCGAGNPGKARFCSNCGARLDGGIKNG